MVINNFVPLKEVAKVYISNVDKKINESEISVKLCNFVDVCYNWAITKNHVNDFMVATAKQSEIDKFTITKGHVAITKDSETRHDIGIPTYIADNLDNVVLAYHCALLIPDEQKILGSYLNLVLNTGYVKKYFANNATGSGQRYTLNIGTIENLQIPLIPIEEQKKVSEIFEAIDRKILANKAINDNLASMAMDIYMHMFFGKEPNAQIADILVENNKSKVKVGDAKALNAGDIPFFTSGEAILKWYEPMLDGRVCYLNTGGNPGIKFYVGKAAYSTDTWAIHAKNDLTDYLYLFLQSIQKEIGIKYFEGTGLQHLQKANLKSRSIYVPKEVELIDFNSKIKPMFDAISDNSREIQQLIKLRDWLLPILMNGQTTVD